MRRDQSLLGVSALLAAGGMLLSSAAPAQAELKVCNSATTTALVAIGYSLNNNQWFSAGWWEIPKNHCGTLVQGDLKPGAFFYLYAKNKDETWIWQGEDKTAWFCINPTARFVFTLKADECFGTGTTKKLFREVMVKGKNHQVNLID